MPIFRFYCENCGEEFEVLQKSSAETASCRSCSSDRVVKLPNRISTPAGASFACGDSDCADRCGCSGHCGCRR